MSVCSRGTKDCIVWHSNSNADAATGNPELCRTRLDEAMDGMECWQVSKHIKVCRPCRDYFKKAID